MLRKVAINLNTKLFPLGVKKILFLLLCTFFTIKLFAQAPPNDNCSNAALILVTNNGTDTGFFHGAKADLKNATLQPGESIDTLQYFAGTDKKTIWYKFTITQHRWVTLELRQNDTLIAQNAVGMTIYKTTDCLPNLGQLSTELPSISQFGNSESTCLPPGAYLIQVSSKLTANDSVWVDILVQHARNSAYDRQYEPFDFGTITSSSTKIINIGCLSIDKPSEICTAFGKSDTDYNQTAWMVFKTPTYSDLFGFNFFSSDNTDTIVFAYNLYEGDARSGPLKLVSGCNIMKQTPSQAFQEIVFKCNIKPNTEYTIQIFAYKYAIFPLSVTLSTQGKDTAQSANPKSLPVSYQLGDISSGGSHTITDQFACNSRMSLYPCGSDMPKYYIDSFYLNGFSGLYLRDTCDINAWFTFHLSKPGSVNLKTALIDCRGYTYENHYFAILYSGDITKNCNLPVLHLSSYQGNGEQLCLPAGDYSFQVVGVSDRHNIYNNVCDDYDLGKQVFSKITFTPLVTEPAAKYDTFPNANNLGDITSTLLSGGSETFPADYYGNRNVKDTIAGAVYQNRILYRQFYIGKPMQIEIWLPSIPGAQNPVNNYLYKGKATDGLKALTVLPSYYKDSDESHYNGGFIFKSGCEPLPAGWYTIIDQVFLGGTCQTEIYANEMVIEQLKMLCPPQYNHPYKASIVNSGTPLDWGPNHGSVTVPDNSKTYTFPQACFDCTIDTPFPANARPCKDPNTAYPPYNRIAYYVFNLKHVSFAYINLTTPAGYNINNENYFYGLYASDIRKDSSVLADSSKNLKPCGHLGNFCSLQPGIYTLVVYTNQINAIIPTIYLDRVVNSKYDNASRACDMGYIPPDNNFHYSPYDTITCTTGAYMSDPEMAKYFNITSSNYIFYGAQKSTVPYPMPSGFNAYYNVPNYQQNIQTIRNLWYTFTATSTGTVYINLHPGFPKTKRYNQWRVSVYKSPRKGSIPFDTLVSHKMVDSTLAQGLVLTNNSDTAYSDSIFAKPDCDTDRYYVVLDYSYYGNGPYLDDQIKISVRYDGTLFGRNGDFCTNAIPMTLNGPGKASGTAVVNCHTTGESFGEDGSNMACLDIGQPYKTTWYKITNTSSKKIDLTVNITNQTNVPSNLIRYRILYGSCHAMTPGPCVESGYASFTLDCMSAGDYYVQVEEPVYATGNITVNAIATPVAFPVCKPFDLLKPLANFSSVGGCNTKTVNFINLSSAGDNIQYSWDFGNGKTSTNKQPSVTYASTKQIDTFHVKLVVTDTANKEKDSLTLPVYFFKDPVTLTVDKSSTVKCGTKVQLHASCNNPNAIYSWTPAAALDDPYIPDPVATVNQNDTFIVTAKIENCIVVDTILVKVDSHIRVNYDNGLCTRDTGILTAPSGYSSYEWSNGISNYYGQQIKVTSAGTYILIAATGAGCYGYDTAVIVKSGPFNGGLPADTTVCTVGSITLSTGSNSGHFLWSTQDTTPTIMVSKSGIYWVNINNGNCFASDTVQVQFSVQSLSLGNDTTICPGSTIVLDPNVNGQNYKWSTGETTPKISVNKAGIYSVTTTVDKCSYVGSKKVSVSSFPPLNLGSPDTSFCLGFSGLIKVNNSVPARYKWSTGDTAASITVNKSGDYSLDVHIGMCDTMLLKHVSVTPLPAPNLGNDTMICYRFEKVLDAGDGQSYHWFPRGDTTRWITVTHGGTYAVVVKNGPGCVKMDTIVIDTACEEGTLFVPNSFTPGKNGINDFFKAEGMGITAFHLQVYNRWGELLFDTRDINKGWDGTFKNLACPLDVYIWIINYTGIREHALIMTGNVTLLR